MKWIIEQFQMKYMLADAPMLGRSYALSDDDWTKIIKHMDENPSMSAHCCVAQELSHTWEMVHTTLKKEGGFPYWISVLHELKPEDYTPHYNYCDWFFEKFDRNIEKLTRIFSDKVMFYLSGYVNSQNYHIWSINNPHNFEETSLHTIKVNIWCTISKHLVVGPIFFFDKTSDSNVYMKIIQDLIALLEEDEW